MEKLIRCLLTLALVLVLSLPALAAGPGLDNFTKVQSYPQGKFTDVPAGSWYADNVKSAYELGLVEGVSSSAFRPAGTVTIAQTVTLAARLHSIYHTGKADFPQGSPWYQVYVDYAAQNGILTAVSSGDYNAPATRAQFAAILAGALPEEALKAVNTVDDGMIPDVPQGAAHYDAIYTLYRAGVLTGNDQAGTFTPNSTITRSAVAAIVTRMADPALRQSITLEDQDAEVTVTLNRTSLSLIAGDTGTLTATVRPAGEKVTWSSSNTSVATVSSSGTVTARAAGTAVITASAGDSSAKCTVTVAKEAEVTSLSMRSTLSLKVGESFTLSCTVYPSNAADPSLTWFCSNTTAAAVSDSGTVTARAAGTAVITAKASNGVRASCTVTITAAQEPSAGGGTFRSDFVPENHGAAANRPTLNDAYLIFMDEADQSSEGGFSFAEAFSLDSAGSGPRGWDVTYTVSDPSVVSVESNYGYYPIFYVNPLSPGRCTITASTGEDSRTVEILIPDTALSVEGYQGTHSVGVYHYNYTGSYTFGPISVDKVYVRLDSYDSSFATYTVALKAYNPTEHDLTAVRLMVDTGSGETLAQEVSVPAGKNITGSNTVAPGVTDFSCQIKVPRGSQATLRLAQPDDDSHLPAIHIMDSYSFSLGGATISDVSVTSDSCSFTYTIYAHDTPLAGQNVTFRLASRDNSFRSEPFTVTCTDGNTITGSGSISGLSEFGDYWFQIN